MDVMEVRSRFGEIVDKVQYQGDTVGQQERVVMPAAMASIVDVISDKEWCGVQKL